MKVLSIFLGRLKQKGALAEQRFSPQERQAYWVSSFGAKLVLHLFVARFFSRSFVSGKSQHGISASTGNDVVTYQQCLHLKHSLQLLAFAPEKNACTCPISFFLSILRGSVFFLFCTLLFFILCIIHCQWYRLQRYK